MSARKVTGAKKPAAAKPAKAPKAQKPAAPEAPAAPVTETPSVDVPAAIQSEMAAQLASKATQGRHVAETQEVIAPVDAPKAPKGGAVFACNEPDTFKFSDGTSVHLGYGKTTLTDPVVIDNLRKHLKEKNIHHTFEVK